MRRAAVPIAVGATAAAAGGAVASAEPLSALALLAGSALFVVAVANLSLFVRGLLAFKGVIDAFYQQAFAGVTLQQALGVIGPLAATVVAASAGTLMISQPLAVPLAAFVGANAIAVLLSSDVTMGLLMFFRIAGPVAFFFAAPALFPDRERFVRWAKVLLIALVVPLGTAFLQLVGVLETPFTEVTTGLNVVRLTGPFSHPWDLTRYLIVAVPLSLFMTEQTEGGEKKFWWAYFLACLAISAFTNLRAAQLIIPTEVILWFALNKQWRRAALFGLLIAAVVLASAAFLSDLYEDALVVVTEAGEASVAGGLSGRVGVWDAYLEGFRRLGPVHQVLGSGLDYERVAAAFGTHIGADPHNDFVRLLVNNGFAGLAIYAWLLVAVAVALWRTFRSYLARSDGLMTRLTAATIVVYVGYVMGSVSARPSQYPSLSWMLWTLVGVVIAGLTLYTVSDADEGGAIADE